MREIKLRVWNRLRNKWLPQEITDKWELRVFQKEREFVNQFTGLKDKNGKEIYEGDIILWDFDNGDGTFDRREDVVKFIIGCFIPDHWRTTVDNTIVIGNIYENPDLTPSQED